MSSHSKYESPPQRLRPWLFDAGSLTRSVQTACAASCDQCASTVGFHMRVLSQHEGLPLPEEAKRLGLPSSEFAIIREVHLMCADQAWVYARSVIPLSTASDEQVYLKQMGEKPLGAALFADPTMRRDKIELVSLLPTQTITDGQAINDETLWGRRSVFWVGEKPLLVAEYFLPAIPDHPVATL